MKIKILRQILAMTKFAFYGICLQGLLYSMLLANDGNAQRKSIEEIYVNIALDNVQLTEALETIERETAFNFFFDKSIVDTEVTISAAALNSTLGHLLREISKNTELKFKRVNDNIYVSRKSIFSKNVEEEIIEEVEPKQQRVTGKVTEEGTDEPLPGVSILIKGTSNGTTSDLDGNFTLEASSTDVLQFSYIGFQTFEVQIGNQTTLNIALQPDLEQLEEVVVVGYGAVKKSDLTGSVSSVKSEELTAYPVIGTVQALQGRAAGVQIQSNNGEPGASFKVRVRGGTSINASSDPLYVIDGFVGGTIPPPEDIESVEVLKDASATAIYGSRGANGVIMITTKKGKAGKMQVNFNSSYSTQEVINRLDLLNGRQFAEYINEINPGFYDLNNIEDTDWQDEIFRTGGIQNYQLSFSGGNENVNYYVSGVYFDQKGIVLNSDYQRYSITSNIDIKASEKFKLGLNLFARRIDRQGVLTQEGSGGTSGSGVVSSAFKFEPSIGIFDENGVYTLSQIGDPHDNPFAIAQERLNDNVNDRLQGNFFGEYELLPDLKFRVTAGASIDNGRDGNYVSTLLNAGENVGGDARINSNKNTLLLNENYFTYSKDLGKSSLTLTAGYSYQSFQGESWGARGQSFITDAVQWWDLDGASIWQRPSSNLSEWELSSWYARGNYNFDERFLFTLTARYDGASRFSEGNKWAFFPSGAVAWNIGNEGFMDNINAISSMKLRASYGETGNQAISPFQTLARFSPEFAVIGGMPVNAVRPTSVANDNLRWETTAQTDIGFDFGLFNDRVTVVTDYYYMKTTDLLFSVPLPEYSGYGSQLQNIGTVENRGFEFTLGSNNLVGAFQWSTDFNISFNRIEVLSLPDGLEIPYNANPGHMVGMDNTQILREGEPVGVFWGFIYDGVYQEGDAFIPGGGFEQEAGGEKYRDINGRGDDGELSGQPDGQLNNDDRTIIGDPNPDYIWGLNNDFRYKGFDLNIFFQASVGGDMLNFTRMELDRLAGSNNATTDALNRWTPTNTNTDIPKATTGRAYRPSTRWVEDGTFVRLKNISLGYNLPSQITDKVGMRSVRVYVSGQNLLTFTNYSGFDPEVNYRAGGAANGNRNLGLDYGSYPNAKGYTFGINIGL